MARPSSCEPSPLRMAWVVKLGCARDTTPLPFDSPDPRSVNTCACTTTPPAAVSHSELRGSPRLSSKCDASDASSTSHDKFHTNTRTSPTAPEEAAPLASAAVPLGPPLEALAEVEAAGSAWFCFCLASASSASTWRCFTIHGCSTSFFGAVVGCALPVGCQPPPPTIEVLGAQPPPGVEEGRGACEATALAAAAAVMPAEGWYGNGGGCSLGGGKCTPAPVPACSGACSGGGGGP
mmetsp:Transcript_38942/g.76774  ORF Transcript_38942/g.76774 Transcript_38942/m.76774 type:complete len:236 (-) Transcript_38942:93-800(-)